MTTPKGFTILETLIAVLVLSSGLLGFAAMQIQGLGMNRSSLLRSQATYRASEMADRMRANLNAVAAGNYNRTESPTAYPSCYLSQASCTPAEMAQADWVEWNAVNASILPQGQGVVCITSTPASGTPAAPACDGVGDFYAIKIWWADDKSGNLKLFSTSFRP